MPDTSVLEVIDRDFRGGSAFCSAPPTRFLVNLTESCNLRCQHCITDAPQRTSAGTARKLETWVVDRLTPHLASCQYLGLTHSGEPTLGPALDTLLERVRQTAPNSVVHMLTNGQTLNEEKFLAWSQKGVVSWSISVDGMSPETHDALRVGSKIRRLLDVIRGVATARRALPFSVRVGLAFTVTEANQHELLDLLRFAAEVGLDWVKLEELVPVRPELQALVVGPEVVTPVRIVARDLGVKLLDHTLPMPYECALVDEATRERSELDDFVNHVFVNACRLPYEQVCIEPDGAVRPIDFHHPIAGHLGEEDLLEIWNGPRFILERTRRARARICGGDVTCPKDPGASFA